MRLTYIPRHTRDRATPFPFPDPKEGALVWSLYYKGSCSEALHVGWGEDPSYPLKHFFFF